MKKIISIIPMFIMCIAMLFVLTGCFSESATAKSDVTATYYLGDTISFDKYTISVDNIQIKTEGTYIDSYQYITDPEWIAITLTYTNTSDEEINLNRNVRLINSKGEVLNPTFQYYNIWNTEFLSDSNLLANGTKTGFLQFSNSIADSAENLTLQISGSSSFSENNTFNFKLYPKQETGE